MFFLCLSWYCVLFLWIVHFWFPLQYFLTIISYHIIFNTDINGLQEFAFLKDDLLFIRCTVISTSNCCEIFCVISNCNFSFTTSFSLYRDGSRAHALFVNKTRVWKSNYIFYWKQNNNLCVKTFRLKPGGNYKNNYYLSNKLKINLFVHNNGNRMNVQIVYHLYYVLLFSFVVSACLIFLCVSFFVFFVLFCLFLCVFYHCCYFRTLSWGVPILISLSYRVNIVSHIISTVFISFWPQKRNCITFERIWYRKVISWQSNIFSLRNSEIIAFLADLE